MDKLHESKAELRSKNEDYRNRSRSPQSKNDSSRDEESKRYREERDSSFARADHRRRRKPRSESSSSSEDFEVKTKTDAKVRSPIVSKISMNLKSSSTSGVQLKLNAPVKKAVAPPPKPSVASAFNDDSEDEVEEMPAECKMRMRNIGKNTPTSSGPNSFGKTKLGFVDSKKIFEKKMQQMLKDMGDPV